jgi:type I restriction enzyme S subunit
MQAFTGKLSKTFREKQSLTRELLNSHILANKKGATKLLAKQQEKEELPEIPVEWIWSNIELVASDEKNSIKAGPFGSALKKEFYVENGYKIYGQEQVIRQNHEYGDYYIDEERYNSLLTCKVQPRDVLISLVGTIGKVLVLPDELEKGIINPRLIKITFNQNLMNPVFFKYYFEIAYLFH